MHSLVSYLYPLQNEHDENEMMVVVMTMRIFFRVGWSVPQSLIAG